MNPESVDPWCDSKCPACKQELRELEPRLLPCLHTLCDACVKSEAANSAPRLACPICHQECLVSDIIDNQFVRELVVPGETPKDDAKPPTCTSCDDDALATSHCTDCSEWLCDACVQAHQRVRVTKDHVIQSKEEAMGDDGNSNPQQKTLFCPTHKQEQLKLFCETCDQLTCRDCQLIEHRDHRYQFVSEASQAHKVFLNSLLGKLQEKKLCVETAKALINKRFREITEREQVVTNEIKMFAIRFITEINRRGKQLLSELHEVCGQKKGCLGQKNHELSEMAKRINHCQHFVEGAMGAGSDAALLYSKRLIKNQLGYVLRSRCDVPNPNHIIDIRFVYENAFLSNYINQFGCLVVDNLPHQLNRAAVPTAPPGHPTNSTSNNNIPGSRLPEAPPYPANRPQLPGVFGAPQPHVSSSTHPVNASRNIHLRNLLETQNGGSMQIPTQVPGVRGPAAPFLPPNGLPSKSAPAPSQLAQANSSIFRMLMRGQQGGMQGYPSQLQAGSQMKAPNQTVGFNMGPLSLSNTQRLSHFPPSASAQATTTGPEARLPSPQSTQSSPGPTSQGPMQVSSRRSSGSASPNVGIWTQSPQSDVRPMSHGDGDASQDRVVHSSANVKQEGGSSSCMSSCSGSSANPKGKKTVDEIDDTARQALRFFCEGSFNPILQYGNELSSKKGTNDAKDGSSADKVPVQQQQADSSCSPSMDARNPATAQGTTSPAANTPGGSSAKPGPQILETHSLQQKGQQSPEDMDPNDDWCAVCHDGGDLLCCGRCPRVYHLQCHVPPLKTFPSEEENWQCLMCRDSNAIHKYQFKDLAMEAKRRNPVGLGGHELRICERVLLELFCHESSPPFHEPVSKTAVPNYHKIITHPMDLATVKQKMAIDSFNRYDDVAEFVQDVRLIFKNCFVFNPKDSVVHTAGKVLEEFFEGLLARHLPEHVVENRAEQQSETTTDSDGPRAKKKKVSDDMVYEW